MIRELSIKINFFNKDGILDNKAIGAGVYMVDLLKDGESSPPLPLYIGESVYMIKRCGEHLFDLFQDSRYFGLTEDNLSNKKLTLNFRVIAYLPAIKTDLKEKEKHYRGEYEPLTQYPTSDRQLPIEEKVAKVQNAIKEKWKS